MKRLINVRISLIFAVSVILGIISFHEALFANYIPISVCCALFLLGVIVFACLKRKTWIFFLLALLFLLVGFFNFWRVYKTRNEGGIISQKGVLVGRVTDIGRVGSPTNTLYLEKCTLEGEKLPGRVKVYVYDGSEYNTGDSFRCFAEIINEYAVHDNVDTDDIRYNVRYEALNAEMVVAESGKLTVGETIRQYIFTVTENYMPKNGDVAYALLTGDRNPLDGTKKDAFIDAGIIHLLVVSGLHVGFVISVFGILLKRLRLPILAELSILLVPLIFYAYICNFSPSVVRAIIMTVCVYLARIVYGRYDLLTSLCWAATGILLWQPLYLYDVGFQLSVLSVFGIATVFLQIDRAMNRRHINKYLKKLISTVALSFSCVAATFFVGACQFGEVSWVGIIVNIVAIPMVFVSFVVAVVGLLPSVFHYVLTVTDYILQGVVEIALWVQKQNLTLHIGAAALAVAVATVLLFVAGGYVNFSKLGKRVTYTSCALVLSVCMIVAMVPHNCGNAVKVFVGYGDNMLVATSNSNEAAVVGSFQDEFVCDDVITYLSARRTSELTLYFTDASTVNYEAVERTLKSLKVSKVYVLNEAYGKNFAELVQYYGAEVYCLQPNRATGSNVRVRSVYDGGLCAVIVEVGNIRVADVVAEGTKARQFALQRPDVDYAVVTDEVSFFHSENISTISFYQQKFATNFGANKCGNFTIYEKDGTIQLNFRRN